MTTAALRKEVALALAWLRKHSTRKTLDAMARYNIPSKNAYGVAMRDVQRLAKTLGRSHDLAEALWQTRVYEAQLLTAYVDEPERVTSAQMDRWAKEFDNWAICDTLCFALWDRTPHAWGKVAKWCVCPEEFVKRTGFAMLWSLTTHDKESGDAPFLKGLKLIERGATDDRNLVKKAVNMALRATGKRTRALNAAATRVARRLAESEDPAARWVGTDALRELTSAKVTGRLHR